MKEEEIIVENFCIKIIRKKMKHVILKVKDNGAIFISAPKFVSQKQIIYFVQDKIDWLKKQIEKRKNKSQEFLFQNGKEICFLGKKYILRIFSSAERNKIVLKDQSMFLFMKNDFNKEDCKNFFYVWSKKVLKQILPQFFDKWGNITGLKVNEFSIRNMKTRWGSCNPKTHKISINVQVVHKPYECLDYLVLHEIAHIYEASHNARFKAFLTKYMPDWRKKRKLLKDN